MNRFCRKIAISVLVLCLTALPLASASVQKDGVHITILHTGNLNAQVFEGEDGALGLGWISGAIWASRDLEDDVLALDAGSAFSGAPVADAGEGLNMTMLLNLASYDALAPGAGDFAYGSDRLVKLAGQLNFPLLSANISTADYKSYVFLPYKTFTLSGVKIAVIGLTAGDIAAKCGAKVENIRITDPMSAARELVPELRKNHDVVIALTNMGTEASTELAKKIRGIDLIIVGDSDPLVKGKKVGQTVIAASGPNGHSLGQVELVVNKHSLKKVSAKLLTKDDIKKLTTAPDAGELEMLEMLKAAQAAKIMPAAPENAGESATGDESNSQDK